MSIISRCLILFDISLCAAVACADDTRSKPASLQEAGTIYSRGEKDKAMEMVSKIIETDPKNDLALLTRGTWYLRERKLAQAIADFDRAIKLDDDNANAFHSRGAARFQAGDVKGSIADFDRQIELAPRNEAAHWQRGISYYYAGRYAEGKQQFESGQETYASDVENVVWRYLCQAKLTGVQKAREDILKLKGDDRRVPMMKIHELYLGRAKPEEVFQAAESGNPGDDELKHRLFYAHLYVGLYYDSVREEAKAKHHLLEADKRAISHYMWDVAHVHVERLRSK